MSRLGIVNPLAGRSIGMGDLLTALAAGEQRNKGAALQSASQSVRAALTDMADRQMQATQLAAQMAQARRELNAKLAMQGVELVNQNLRGAVEAEQERELSGERNQTQRDVAQIYAESREGRGQRRTMDDIVQEILTTDDPEKLSPEGRGLVAATGQPFAQVRKQLATNMVLRTAGEREDPRMAGALEDWKTTLENWDKYDEADRTPDRALALLSEAEGVRPSLGGDEKLMALVNDQLLRRVRALLPQTPTVQERLRALGINVPAAGSTPAPETQPATGPAGIMPGYGTGTALRNIGPSADWTAGHAYNWLKTAPYNIWAGATGSPGMMAPPEGRLTELLAKDQAPQLATGSSAYATSQPFDHYRNLIDQFIEKEKLRRRLGY